MMQIPLTQGKFAVVDDEDYEWLTGWKWCASLESRGTKWYAIRREKGQKIRMHRVIMGLPTGKEDARVVDHLNHDSLDNRRSNLEIITQEENMRRSPGWKRKKEDPYL